MSLSAAASVTTRALRAGNEREASNLQSRSVEFVLFLTLPAAAAIWMLSDEMIRVVYEHGVFTAAMTGSCRVSSSTSTSIV